MIIPHAKEFLSLLPIFIVIFDFAVVVPVIFLQLLFTLFK